MRYTVKIKILSMFGIRLYFLKYIFIQYVAIIICILVYLTQCIADIHADELQVSGVGEFRKPSFQKGMHGEPYINEYFWFSMVVKGEKWFLHYSTDDVLNQGDYNDITYDGRHMYVYHSIETWVKDQLSVGNKIGSNLFTAYIVESNIPCFSYYHHAGIIWLSYASHRFFRTNINPQVRPAATYGVGRSRALDPLDKYSQQYEHTILDPSFPVPAKLIYIAEPDGPFERGYTNTIYEVHSVTNYKGHIIPMSASMKTYIPYRKPLENQTNLLLIASYNIKATNISLSVPDNIAFRPLFRGLAFVGDMRFKDRSTHPIDAINYYSDKWLQEEEVIKHPKYVNAMKKYNQEKQKRRPIALIAFTLIVLIPFAYTLYKKYTSSANKNN